MFAAQIKSAREYLCYTDSSVRLHKPAIISVLALPAQTSLRVNSLPGMAGTFAQPDCPSPGRLTDF